MLVKSCGICTEKIQGQKPHSGNRILNPPVPLPRVWAELWCRWESGHGLSSADCRLLGCGEGKAKQERLREQQSAPCHLLLAGGGGQMQETQGQRAVQRTGFTAAPSSAAFCSLLLAHAWHIQGMRTLRSTLPELTRIPKDNIKQMESHVGLPLAQGPGSTLRWDRAVPKHGQLFVPCALSRCQQHIVPSVPLRTALKGLIASPWPLKCWGLQPVPSWCSGSWHPFRFVAPCHSAQGSCWDFAVNRVLFPFWGGAEGTRGLWQWQLL